MREFLAKVERPAQYIGGEYNSIVKNWQTARARMAFLFPDTYEIGMSHLGLRILYEAVNQTEGFLLERCFTPMEDMRALLKAQHVPLASLESDRPVRDFDVLGFTLQYELSYTNILDMLDLAGLPLLAAERTEAQPFIIAGGPCAYNPEPLADFIDLFCIGESETQLLELLELVAQAKQENLSKENVLRRALAIPGVYVPRFYTPQYKENGDFAALAAAPFAPATITKALVTDLNAAPFPCSALLPQTEVVHDRMTLEIMRGCGRGCRFCQAGIIYRPVREKDPALLLEQANQLSASTGYEDMGLISLSSADYSQIVPLTQALLEQHGAQGMGVSLPSLRVDAFSVGLANQAGSVRKSGLTFAPEAGSQRLRDVINKGVEEQDIMSACAAAFSQGYTNVKLYFMIGLPYESKADIAAIAELCKRILQLYREKKPAGQNRPVKISLGVASFVPKAHTPFQWHAQDSQATLREKQDYLRQQIKSMKQVQLKRHDSAGSVLEAAFARGDRRLGPVLLTAWQLGCRADGWSEHFKPELWQEAFAAHQLTPAYYAERTYAFGEPLPWQHIATGVTPEWLWRENDKARQGILTADCREGVCTECGVCSTLASPVQLAPPLPQQPTLPTPKLNPPGDPVQRWRLRLAITDQAAWLSHLDLLSALEKALRRAAIPMAFSQGFNPHMLISWGPAHPVGLLSQAEYLDLYLAMPLTAWPEEFNRLLPPGLRVLHAKTIDSPAPALMKAVDRADYTLTFAPKSDTALLADHCTTFMAATEWLLERVSPKGRKTVNIRPAVLLLHQTDNQVHYGCRLGAGAAPKPAELATILLPQGQLETMERTAMYIGAQNLAEEK